MTTRRFLHPITGEDLGSYKAARRVYFMEAALHEAAHAVAAISGGALTVDVSLKKEHGLINFSGVALYTVPEKFYSTFHPLITLAGPVANCIEGQHDDAPLSVVSARLRQYIRSYGVYQFGEDFRKLKEIGITPDNWDQPHLEQAVVYVRSARYYIKRVQDKFASLYYDGCTSASVRVVKDSKNFLRCLPPRPAKQAKLRR